MVDLAHRLLKGLPSFVYDAYLGVNMLKVGLYGGGVPLRMFLPQLTQQGVHFLDQKTAHLCFIVRKEVVRYLGLPDFGPVFQHL